ncbi:LLM class flavin-dependent oxidoreductase [Kitasatospora sp. NPDC092286]|uniref:LLM class flavin-dependent oxidoreductase n=1 Tax=Kitasatospora sp. NPDC092286 TaxID=3364087 RepID=UPI0038077CB8
MATNANAATRERPGLERTGLERPGLERLGLLVHVAGQGDPRTVLDQHLRLAVVAEELGYDSFWIAQHHLGAESGVVPSPFVFLAAVAARTHRIRLGTAVVTLPLEDPVRVAEDAAQADLLSGGRIELGIGSGAHRPSFEAFGRDFEQRRADQERAARVLEDTLRGGPLPGGAPLHPPAPGLADRIWQAAVSGTERARLAAAAGHGLLLSRTTTDPSSPVGEAQVPTAEAYFKKFDTSRGTRPRLGVSRTVYPVADRATAVRDLAPGARSWLAQAATEWAGRDLAATESDDDALLRRHDIHAGPVEAVTAGLAADPALALATDLIVQFQPGLPSFGSAVGALEAIATRVAPALGLRPRP